MFSYAHVHTFPPRVYLYVVGPLGNPQRPLHPRVVPCKRVTRRDFRTSFFFSVQNLMQKSKTGKPVHPRLLGSDRQRRGQESHHSTRRAPIIAEVGTRRQKGGRGTNVRRRTDGVTGRKTSACVIIVFHPRLELFCRFQRPVALAGSGFFQSLSQAGRKQARCLCCARLKFPISAFRRWPR